MSRRAAKLTYGQLVVWERSTRSGKLDVMAAYHGRAKLLIAVEVQTNQGPAIRYVQADRVRAADKREGIDAAW